MSFAVEIVPVLQDNYSYLIVDEVTKDAAVVDPVDPKKCIAKATELGVNIKCILTTHSHWDHAGGNNAMRTLVSSDLIIYGGFGDDAEGVTKELKDGDEIILGENVIISTLFTPCHTPGHVCYYVKEKKLTAQNVPGAVFTGDTLFVCGCGNFNSGTPKQMYHALYNRIGSLPDETKVYVGHEYTVKNMRYALTAEPNNEKLKEKLEWALVQRESGIPTVPSTISSEKETNPFMRVNEKSIQEYTGLTDPIEVLTEVRKRKSAWRG